MTGSDNLLTVAEICNLLKVSKTTVYDMISDGRLPRFVLPGVNKILVKRSDIERIING
jgi:excisionase family DNA binding protein|tara:strand:- start:17 stop:190 length:174 start_codon:yes stop_codon:yes gene_type:complete